MVRVEMRLGQQTLADIERALIDEVLRLADDNKTLAAKYLGLTRFALDRRLKKGGRGIENVFIEGIALAGCGVSAISG